MEIEVDKTYRMMNAYKKSVIEIEYKKKGKKQAVIETCWRSGSWNVIPQNEDEIEYLKSGLEGESIEIYEFEELEFLETWDGCSEDWEFYNIDEDEQETIQEAWREDGHMWFDDNEWSELDPEVIIHNGILLEEIDYENPYA